jgi:hypothetical protein
MGAQLNAEGGPAHGQPAIAGRLSFRYGRLTLAALGTVGLPAVVADPWATLRLTRHSAALFAGVSATPRPRVTLHAGAVLGGVLFERVTSAARPGLEPAPAASSGSWLVGPELGLAFIARRRRADLGVMLTVGVDLVPAAPIFGYEVDGRFDPVLRLARVQPRVGLALVAVRH